MNRHDTEIGDAVRADGRLYRVEGFTDAYGRVAHLRRLDGPENWREIGVDRLSQEGGR